VEFHRRPLHRPTSLIRTGDGRLILRIRSEAGERMATHLAPMSLRDAFRQPVFYRRPR
jgi:hypothetical protein